VKWPHLRKAFLYHSRQNEVLLLTFSQFVLFIPNSF
jgi:hypothetical protein